MATTLNWGILGTGQIARTFAKGLAASRTGTLLAVASRSQATADAFGEEMKAPRRYGTYDALLADGDVQAVYVSTPHPFHVKWAIRAAEAKKHILCEKPIGLNFAEAMAIVEAARANDVFLMEAFMYRCHPQTFRIVEMIKSGAIGEVRVIHATFSFHWPKTFDASSRLLNPSLAGGGILDVGGYCTSMARLIAGAAVGKDFAEPIEVKGVAHLGMTGVDEYALAVARFPGDIVAQLSTGVQVQQESEVRIDGTEGAIFVPNPWAPGKEGGKSQIFIRRHGESATTPVVIEEPRPLYAVEADTVAENIERREAIPPAMTWDDTLGNMRMLDRWRESIGLVYDSEKLENLIEPAAGRPLRFNSKGAMKRGRLPGLEKQLSRLAIGADFSGESPREAFVILDEAFERGINFFDTAHIYGGGRSDKNLGHWLRTRGVREQAVILAKGAHTPHCVPEAVGPQLDETLDRLGTDHVDLYLLHRDNPQVPVGEFVDVLNELKRAGKLRIFGGSNWGIPRIEAANEYARSRQLESFTAVSNNFSLARMLDPIWPGCISSSDAESRSWFARTELPMIPWSSQARGFFSDRSDPRRRDDAEMVRVWYSEDNFQRKARAYELASQRNVAPTTIALAYVLNQPFPTFPLIGPRRISELRESVAALEVELSLQELAWLNLQM
jgi:predicted dehydrogenase/diketogulonate reductase-like aldo/keto reductase